MPSWFKKLHKRQQLTIYFVALTLFSLILIGGGMYYYFTANKFETYRNEQAGFQIRYPVGWEVKENYEGAAVVFLSPIEGPMDTFRENITVVVQNLSGNPQSMKKYTKVALKQMLALFGPDVMVLESKPGSLGGKPAHRLHYRAENPDKSNLQLLHIWMVTRLKAYQINITGQIRAFDSDMGLYNSIIRSFKLL